MILPFQKFQENFKRYQVFLYLAFVSLVYTLAGGDTGCNASGWCRRRMRCCCAAVVAPYLQPGQDRQWYASFDTRDGACQIAWPVLWESFTRPPTLACARPGDRTMTYHVAKLNQTQKKNTQKQQKMCCECGER